MKLAKRIFRRDDYYITSNFGKRDVISTGAGNTSSFHYGVDYGTNGEKWPQYALEDGKVISCGNDSAANGYAKFVWVKYPRLGIKLLHYHLDDINVVIGQKVTKNTILGSTGKTGKATGIHLHLGMKYLNNNAYVDPEMYDYKEPNTFLHKRGYFKYLDYHKNIGKIAAFMYKTFPSYTKKSALGNLYGNNLKKAIVEFQRRSELVPDGFIGPITLEELEKYGFKY